MIAPSLPEGGEALQPVQQGSAPKKKYKLKAKKEGEAGEEEAGMEEPEQEVQMDRNMTKKLLKYLGSKLPE